MIRFKENILKHETVSNLILVTMRRSTDLIYIPFRIKL